MSAGFEDEDEPGQARAGAGGRFEVDARGGAGLQIGDQGTQYNYFIYQGTLFYGLLPPPLLGRSGTISFPYRGLSAFAEQDWPLFYGRDRAVAQLLDRMSRCLDGTGLPVVSGVSGAGKSSLVRAGALPRLREAGLSAAPEAAKWPRLVLTPGSRPLEALAVSVATITGANAPGVLGDLTRDPGGFALTARQAARARLDTAASGGLPDEAGRRRVLLVVDQVEQLFTQCDSEDERLMFITALHAAATVPGTRHPAALVVLVVRADFEARLAEYPLLAQAVQDRYLLTAMNELELRTAITQPAKEAGSYVEGDLVDELLREMLTRSGRPGAVGGRVIGTGVLPLLSHALDQAWRLRVGQALTLADYARTGGIEGAVASSARHAFNQLTPAQQRVARQVFTRLVTTTSDGTDVIDTAVRATRAELTEGRDQAGAADVRAVLEAFAAQRLLTLDRDSVEISHEALLTAPLLRDWLAETRGDRAIRTSLETSAGEWHSDRRDSSYLYGSARLEAVAEAVSRIDADARQGPLSRAAQDFLMESRQAIARQVRRRRSFTTILIVLVVGLAAATLTAFRANQSATRQRDAAISGISGELANVSEVTGDSDPTASRLESMVASAIDPSSAHAQAQARYAMLRAAASPEITILTRAPGPVSVLAFSPRGATLASGDAYGAVGLWNAATGKKLHILKAGTGRAASLAFSPDGGTLVTDDAGSKEARSISGRSRPGKKSAV